MALQSSASTADPLKFSEVQAEFTTVSGTSMRDYLGVTVGVPSTGTLNLTDFLGTSADLIYDVTVGSKYVQSGGTYIYYANGYFDWNGSTSTPLSMEVGTGSATYGSYSHVAGSQINGATLAYAVSDSTQNGSVWENYTDIGIKFTSLPDSVPPFDRISYDPSTISGGFTDWDYFGPGADSVDYNTNAILSPGESKMYWSSNYLRFQHRLPNTSSLGASIFGYSGTVRIKFRFWVI
jgi:hypothetical protein